MFKKIFLWMLVTMMVVGGYSTTLATPSRQGIEVITPENASQLVEQIRLSRGSAVQALFSPDGSMIMVAGSIGIWQYTADNLGTETEPPHVLTEEKVRAIAFSPDGSTLAASISGDIVFFDAASLEETARIKPSSGTDSFTYSPDGSMLAINAGSSGILLYDIAAQSETKLTGSFDSSAPIRFSPKGTYLAAVGSDYGIYLWDVAANAEHGALKGHTSSIDGLVFAPTADALVSAAADGSIRVWNPSELSEIDVITDAGGETFYYARGVAISSDEVLLAATDGDGNLMVWDQASEELVYRVEASLDSSDIDTVAFSPDDTQILGVSNHTVYLWSAESGDLVSHTVGHTNSLDAIAFSPDSSTLLITDYNDDMWLWDVAGNQELHLSPLIVEGGNLGDKNETSAAYSPDGTMIASTDGFSVRLWNAETHELIHTLEGDGITSSLAFSPDSALLAYVSSSGTYVFSTVSGELLVSFEDNTDWVNGVTFSPDQTKLATVASDNTVRVYSLP